MSRRRCVDCGFLFREGLRSGEVITLTERERSALRHRAHQTDPTYQCYAEFDGFDATRVRETIDCSIYIYRIRGTSPREHLEMRQIIDARQEAQEARDQQRRLQVWNLVGLGIVAATSVAAVVLGSLNLLLS